MIVNQAALTAVGRGFSTIFQKKIPTVKSTWQLVAMPAPSKGKSNFYPMLGGMPGMRKWVGDRVVKNLEAYDYELINDPWESTIEVDRDEIQDDLIGVYKPHVASLAQGAVIHRDQLVYKTFPMGFTRKCFDGQYFFDTDHPVGADFVSNTGGGTGEAWYLLDLNWDMKPFILQIRQEPKFEAQVDSSSDEVFMRKKFRYGVDDRKVAGFGLWQLAYGSRQPLTPVNYAAARAMLMTQKDNEGNELAVHPTHLVVHATLETAGRQLVEKEFLATGESNDWKGTAKLMVSPFLPSVL